MVGIDEESRPEEGFQELLQTLCSIGDVALRSQIEQQICQLQQQIDQRVDGYRKQLATLDQQLNAVSGLTPPAEAVQANATAQKEIEAALRESEERFRQLAEHIDDAFWLAEAETFHILYVSPAFEQIWGYSLANLYRDNDLGMNAVHPDDYPHVSALLPQLSEGDFDLECRIIRADGLLRWIRARAFPVRNQQGRVYRIAGLVEDITDRKQVEEQLRQLNEALEERVSERTAQLGDANEALQRSEVRHRALLEAMPDMFFRVNREGVFLDFSIQSGQTLISPEQIVGTTVRDLPLPPEVIERSLSAYERALATGATQTIEYTLDSLSGSSHYESRIVCSGLDEVVVIVRDITDRKHAELQIRQLNEELEERVHQRTAELEVANRELESFSFSVSHDLRAPLRAMNGFSQALLEDYSHLLDSEGQKYLRRLRSASLRMGTLIDDLLNLSRVTRHELTRVSINLSTLATNIMRELCDSHPQRAVELIIAPDLQAQADAKLMRIALDNLLSNAWKYTSKRAQTQIEFGQIIHNQQPIYFVKDNGAGFDMTYVDKLFHPFQRLHREEEFEGTGIGLATVERIIRRHGGRVWAEGVAGAGATFYFTLG